MANLNRCQAQDRIFRGEFNQTDYAAVYDLYLTAYGRVALAEQAKSRAAELYAEEAMRRAQHKA
ncbi:MAG: hypothetical protein WD872_17630 [Pirellulaceae bacterium]